MAIEDEFKLKVIGKEVTLTIRGKDSFHDLEIKTFVRQQFIFLNGMRYILRCNIKEYILDILQLVSKSTDPLTIISLEIEGLNFIPHPIELHADQDIILPVLEFVVNPDRGKDKVEIFNAYIDKISYQATYHTLSKYYSLDF